MGGKASPATMRPREALPPGVRAASEEGVAAGSWADVAGDVGDSPDAAAVAIPSIRTAAARRGSGFPRLQDMACSLARSGLHFKS
jgi:hypothetical protein